MTRGVEQFSARRDSVRLWVAAAVTFAFATGLVSVAIPRTIAAWLSIESEATYEKTWNVQQPPSDPDLKAAASSFERAIAWSPSAARLAHLAVVELTQAQRFEFRSREREAILVKADEHLAESLSINPADGYVWLALATVRQLRALPPHQVMAAAMQSLDMAPNGRGLWLPRVSMIFVYASLLETDDLLAVRSQLRTIWQAGPPYQKQLVIAALQKGQFAMLASAFERDPEAEAQVRKLEQEVMARP